MEEYLLPIPIRQPPPLQNNELRHCAAHDGAGEQREEHFNALCCVCYGRGGYILFRRYFIMVLQRYYKEMLGMTKVLQKYYKGITKGNAEILQRYYKR